MLNKLTKITAISALALFSQVGLAHEGWVKDTNGDFVFTSKGHCVLHSGESDIEGCLPKPEPEPAPEPAPAPAPAPEPAPEPEPEPVVEPAPIPEPAADVPARILSSFSLEGDALFDTNESALTSGGRASVTQLVSDIKAAENLEINTIFVEGHADSRGAEEYNQRLSEARAQSVADFMVERGIDPALLDVAGAGELIPVATNDTAEGRAQNRRVEIKLIGTTETYKD